MKIGVLYERWHETEEYPGQNMEEAGTGRKRKRPKLDREEVFAALTKCGHEPVYIELDGENQTLFGIARAKVDLIFNTPSGKGARRDEGKVRASAVQHGVPCITTAPAFLTRSSGTSVA